MKKPTILLTALTSALVSLLLISSCAPSQTDPETDTETGAQATDTAPGTEAATAPETAEITETEPATDEVTETETETETETVTETETETETEVNQVEILDPSTLPLKYTQADVCAEPALNGYAGFASMADTTFIVPGLDQGFVPQGMDYWADRGWMLISCYNADTSVNSVLFAVDVQTGKLMAEYYLENPDGSVYNGHAGGVAVTEKNVYISSGKALHRIPLEDLDAAKQCGYVHIKESISVPVRASFCNYSGGILWVGDFHLESAGNTTDEFRHMENRVGEVYKAWTVGYILDETTENEFKASALVSSSYATPDYILSMCDKIQGMTFVPEQGKIVLSESYGRKNNSTIYAYDNPMDEDAHTTVELNGVSVPVWFLDSKTGVEIYPAIPMAEGIANVNGSVYILFESGAEKYRLDGGKLPTDMVYALDLSK